MSFRVDQLTGAECVAYLLIIHRLAPPPKYKKQEILEMGWRESHTGVGIYSPSPEIEFRRALHYWPSVTRAARRRPQNKNKMKTGTHGRESGLIIEANNTRYNITDNGRITYSRRVV